MSNSFADLLLDTAAGSKDTSGHNVQTSEITLGMKYTLSFISEKFVAGLKKVYSLMYAECSEHIMEK